LVRPTELQAGEVDMLQNLFSSNVRVALLTHFFSHPDERFYARELARELEEHYNAVWRELNNLEALGLLAGEENANVKYYRLNSTFPIYEELKRIILKTTGLGQVIRQDLGRLGAIEWAFVFGSVAAGDEDLLSDIDLMLVGEVDLVALSEVISRLEDKLRRAINYVVLSQPELEQRMAAGEPFLTNVLAGPKILLIGEESGLREVVAAEADSILPGETSGGRTTTPGGSSRPGHSRQAAV
jgi:predicted nucleotidyltransferase